VVKASTPVCVWDTLRKAGFSTIATKPLYESKLQHLLHTMADTELGPAAQLGSFEQLRSSEERFRQEDEPGAKPLGHCLVGVDGEGAKWAECPGVRPRVGRDQPSAALAEEPAVKRGDGAGVLSVPSKSKMESLSPPLIGRTLLVAEDNDLLRKLAVQAMLKLGARAVAVENGRLAVDEIERRAASNEGSFDFVLMDCMVRPMYHGCPMLGRV
jgi:hypothetical protein